MRNVFIASFLIVLATPMVYVSCPVSVPSALANSNGESTLAAWGPIETGTYVLNSGSETRVITSGSPDFSGGNLANVPQWIKNLNGNWVQEVTTSKQSNAESIKWIYTDHTQMIELDSAGNYQIDLKFPMSVGDKWDVQPGNDQWSATSIHTSAVIDLPFGRWGTMLETEVKEGSQSPQFDFYLPGFGLVMVSSHEDGSDPTSVLWGVPGRQGDPSWKPVPALLHEFNGGNLVKHTQRDIVKKWIQDHPTYNGTYYSQAPSAVPPYKPGALRPEFLEDGLKMANFVRYIAGLPDDLVLNSQLDNQAQFGAVLTAARDVLDHTPPKPQNMPDSFYKVGYQSTSSGNLDKSFFPSLPDTIDAYMDDSDPLNVDKVGHRRWILNPPLYNVGFGMAMSPSDSAFFSPMQVFDRNGPQVAYDFVSWPTAGYFPLGVDFFQNTTAWSVSLNPSLYDTPEANLIKVTLTRNSDHKTWRISSSNQSSGYFHVDNEGFGISNAIIFQPIGAAYKDGSIYQVSISGLTTTSGKPASVNYAVHFFALSLPSTVPTPSVHPITNQSRVIAGSIGQPSGDWYPVPYKITAKVGTRWLSTVRVAGGSHFQMHIPIQPAGTKITLVAVDNNGFASKPVNVVVSK